MANAHRRRRRGVIEPKPLISHCLVTETIFVQECIPVGCVLYGGGSPWTETPLDPPGTETPWTETPLDRDPPWTETTPLTETTLDRHPPWTEIPLDRDHPPE